MTRHQDPSLPTAATVRRARRLGVDPGLMDAVDAMLPQLSVPQWEALAARAGRPVADIMQAELTPRWGLGLHAGVPGATPNGTPMPTQKDSYEGVNDGSLRTTRDPEQQGGAS